MRDDGMLSPSSRRAWIEISLGRFEVEVVVVALLAEGVDRNAFARSQVHLCGKSPSSRRAWIEMCRWTATCCGWLVALLAEGVDRNELQEAERKLWLSRPPRGGRG